MTNFNAEILETRMMIEECETFCASYAKLISFAKGKGEEYGWSDYAIKKMEDTYFDRKVRAADEKRKLMNLLCMSAQIDAGMIIG